MVRAFSGHGLIWVKRHGEVMGSYWKVGRQGCPPCSWFTAGLKRLLISFVCFLQKSASFLKEDVSCLPLRLSGRSVTSLRRVCFFTFIKPSPTGKQIISLRHWPWLFFVCVGVVEHKPCPRTPEKCFCLEFQSYFSIFGPSPQPLKRFPIEQNDQFPVTRPIPLTKDSSFNATIHASKIYQ